MPKFFALLGFLTTALFWADLRGALRFLQTRTGVIEHATGTVRRLVANQLAWDVAVPGLSVGKNDAVATDAESTARIVLDAGGEILLGPNSMVVLEKAADRLVLHLLRGTPKVRAIRSALENIRVETPVQKNVEIEIVPKIADTSDSSIEKTTEQKPPVVEPDLKTRAHPVRVK